MLALPPPHFRVKCLIMSALVSIFVMNATALSAQNCLPIHIGATNSVTLASQLPSSILSGNSITGKQFSFDGTLIVDMLNLIISNSTIEMGAGSEIRIKTGNELIIQGSKLTSCGNGSGTMWQGIRLEAYRNYKSFTTIRVLNNSTIEDAINGIHNVRGIPSGPYVDSLRVIVDNSTFNRNLIDLSLSRQGSSSFWACDVKITRSNFTCVNAQNQNSKLNAPNSSSIKFIALKLDSIVYNGNANSTIEVRNNRINYCDYGIYTRDNRLTVLKCDISNTTYGVFAEHDNIVTVDSCTISNALNSGVATKYWSKIDVTNSLFKNNRRGVYLFDVVHQFIVENNTFENTKDYAVVGNNFYHLGSGISSIAPKVYVIKNNRMRSTTLSKGGIYMAQVMPIAPHTNTYNPIQLTDNDISSVKNGIVLVNLNLLQNPARLIKGNTISVKGDSPYDNGVGISLVNSRNFYVLENKITGGVAFCSEFGTTKGVLIENSPNTSLQCNVVDQLGRGFSYNGNTPNSRFTDNTMQRCKYQFYLLQNPGLGAQAPNSGDSHNIFTKYPSVCNDLPYHTYSDASNYSPNLSRRTTFYYNNPAEAPFRHGSSSSIPLSFCQSRYTSSVSASLCKNKPEPPSPEYLKDLANQKYDESQAVMHYQNQGYVYGSLLAEPKLQNDPELGRHFLGLKTANVGIWYDALQAVGTPGTDQDSLVTEIAGIVPENVAEENYQHLVPMYIHGQRGKAYTAQNIDHLTKIANQCPYSGGHGVYMARVLLQYVTDSTLSFEDDCEAYKAQVASAIAKKAGANTGKIVVEKEGNTLYLYHKLGEPISVGLYDVQGRLLKTYPDYGYQILNLNGYAAGIYMVRVSTEGETIETLKIPVTQ